MESGRTRQNSKKLKESISSRQMEMNEAALRFEQVILRAANTAADLALRTAGVESRTRKTASARKAYQTAMSLLPRLDVPKKEGRIICEQLDELKEKLELLEAQD